MAQTEAQKRATAKYRAKNKEKVKHSRIRSYARQFITEASAEELTELKKLIDERYSQLK